MNFARCENIYDTFNLFYPFAKISGLVPFTRTKLKNGKYFYTEDRRNKFITGFGELCYRLQVPALIHTF